MAQRATMFLRLHDIASEYSIITVTILYSASLSISTTVLDSVSRHAMCNPLIPFGECFLGEYESRFEILSTDYVKYWISFVIIFLVGAWSDSHGRRRKPLIVLPILGQIIFDGLYFVKIFWYWPRSLGIIFNSVIPGFFVGRNMFWIGVISYVSENSSIKLRTLKLGIIIAIYNISSLIGLGVVALIYTIKHSFYRYNYEVFMVPILLNLIAAFVGYCLVKDTSDVYQKNNEWLRPKYLLKSFAGVLKNKSKTHNVVLVILVLCQSVLVARIGCEYALIMQYTKRSFTWYDEGYVHFNLFKMAVLFFGTVFSVYLFSYKMGISDIVIGISICCFYIFAAICYIFTSQMWQISMIVIIYLCHGTAVTIIPSLTSKMVEKQELGRLNSIQTNMNFLLTFGIFMAYHIPNGGYHHITELGHYCLVILTYVILTLPILFAFVFFQRKYKDFWTEKTTTKIDNSIYIISR